jgi:hypothetical protein
MSCGAAGCAIHNVGSVFAALKNVLLFEILGRLL